MKQNMTFSLEKLTAMSSVLITILVLKHCYSKHKSELV